MASLTFGFLLTKTSSDAKPRCKAARAAARPTAPKPMIPAFMVQPPQLGAGQGSRPSPKRRRPRAEPIGPECPIGRCPERLRRHRRRKTSRIGAEETTLHQHGQRELSRV